MKIIEVDCIEVTVPDGAGMHNDHVGYFSTMEIAKSAFPEKPGSWPHYFSLYKKTFRICESASEFLDLVTAEKRRKALAKLTIDEQKMLGLA